MRFFKKALTLSLATLAILTLTTHAAFAGIIPVGPFGGYNDPIENTASPKGPHGGYITTSSKCKDCHAVHMATGKYKLTRADSRDQTCEFCHNNSNIAGVDIVLGEFGHGVDTDTTTSTVTAPDDTSPPYSVPLSKWGCLECHSVHDNQTVRLSGYSSTKLLKSDPNPGKTYSYYTPITGDSSQTISHWCSACHNANLGSHTDTKTVHYGGTTQTVFSHDSSGTGYTTDAVTGFAIVAPDDGINRGPTCKQCHPADGGNFPHSGISANMLKGSDSTGTAILTRLDGVCTGCHNTSSLP